MIKSSNNDQNFTLEQQAIVREFTENYGLKPEQINFEGDSTEPIFNYAALNTLRSALTDIESTKPTINFYNESAGVVTVSCEIVTANGVRCSDLGSGKVGDYFPDGSTVDNMTQAQNLAIARAFRRALRSAGINLLELHRNRGNTENKKFISYTERLRTLQKEIHALATETNQIVGSDRSRYENLIASLFPGRKSSTELNEIEQSILLTQLRGIKYQQNSEGRTN